MADYYYTSRYRIKYYPKDDTELVLLDLGDWCDAPLDLAASLNAQVEQPILSTWASHQSRGNAQLQLGFTRYVRFDTREAAQIAGLERLMYMTNNPQGELLLETAYESDTSAPGINVRLNATLTNVTWHDQSGDNIPGNAWLALSYIFIISPQDDSNS